MTIRNAEARLPQTFVAKPGADARAVRAFWRGGFLGFACAWVGFLIGVLLT